MIQFKLEKFFQDAMLKEATTIFLAITLIAAVVVGIGIEPADAKKASGTHNQKFGSQTAGIVCGDRLCSEPEESEQPVKSVTVPTTEPKTNMCGSNSIQTESGCLNTKITGAKIASSSYDDATRSTIIQINAQNDGKITIMNANSLNDPFVLVDDEQWDDVFVDGNQVTIEFYAGTETIEIFGN